MATTESSRLLQNRAYAATRVLERRRISLEAAVEVLEIVGYKVYQDREGHYNVEPPHDILSKYDTFPEVKIAPAEKAEFLAEYPTMLTVKDVVEITGFAEGSVRRLCKEGKIPSMKIGGRIRVPKRYLLDSFDTDGNAEDAAKSLNKG
ncbi:MAG: helix-turn-helix domain-containing protein [Atopobiaceae bacterium]|nr:helix-turn-helix domain-containing protein [Atopobiaceae bacterium]